MNLSVFKNLAGPTQLLVMVGSAFLFFDINFWMMKNLPGSRDQMCIVGGNYTTGNLIYSVLLSLMAGTMIAGVFTLFQRRQSKLAASTTTGAGLLVGGLTVFCTACTLPVISLFGISIGLTIFTTYGLPFKIVSLLIMAAGLWIVNRQLDDRCEICEG
ncbi:MAG: hypothetical protein O3B47_00250 [bacterium]|nr:hypothetical protein [bacterium]